MSLVAVSLVTGLIAKAEENHIELPMPAPLFGVLAAVVFAALGFVMFSYRDVANRHAHKTNAAMHPGGSDTHGHDATASGH